MESPHLNDEELMRASYGIGDRHITTCDACRDAAAALANQRLAGRAIDLPDAFWLRQRQAILERTLQPAPARFRRAAFALSLMVLLALVVLIGINNRPAPELALYRAEDQQFLAQIQAMSNRIEPQALVPMGLLVPQEAKQQ